MHRRVLFLFAVIFSFLFAIPQASFAASQLPVAQIAPAGLDGQAGTIFGWLDQSFPQATNVMITTRTITLTGTKAWQGYDRNGNLVSGSAGQSKTFPIDGAPVQIVTPGTYSYKVTVTDGNNQTATSSTQSFTIAAPPAYTTATTISSIGKDGGSASVGFSAATSGSRSATANNSTLTVNPHAPFVIYDATSGNVETETWSVQSAANSVWSGTTGNGAVTSTGTGGWSFSRGSGVHFIDPYTYRVQIGGGYYETYLEKDAYRYWGVVGYEPRCRSADNEYDHTGGCYEDTSHAYSKEIYGWIDVPAKYGQRLVPPVYENRQGGNYWVYGSFPNPDANLVNSFSNIQSYRIEETDGKVTFGLDLTVDPLRPNLADFTMGNPFVATTQGLSGLGITPTGFVPGATETWHVYTQQGAKTFASLAAMNAFAFTVSADMGATVSHEVSYHNQTYVSSATFIVKHAGFVRTSTGGVVQVSDIAKPAPDQAVPTAALPVKVKAGGEVTYQVQTIGNVGSVVVTYSDGLTQTLKQKTPGVWEGYYYPSSTQTIPLTVKDGTSVTLTSIKATTTDGTVLNETSPLLIVSGSASPNGGGTLPSRIIE